MKIVTSVLLVGSAVLNLMVPKTIAQIPSSNIRPPSCVNGELLKKLDTQTIICRNKKLNQTSGLRKLDELYLYRSNPKGDLILAINMVVYEDDNLILVTLGEFNSECIPGKPVSCDSLKRSTQFYLKGRTFLRWISKPDKELVEYYRKDISALLDTQNKPINNF